jgi:hypothetical protein
VCMNNRSCLRAPLAHTIGYSYAPVPYVIQMTVVTNRPCDALFFLSFFFVFEDVDHCKRSKVVKQQVVQVVFIAGLCT